MKKFKFIQKASPEKVKNSNFLRAIHENIKKDGTDKELITLLKKYTVKFKKSP